MPRVRKSFEERAALVVAHIIRKAESDDIYWHETDVTVTEINRLWPELSRTYVHLLMRRMVDEGYLHVEKIESPETPLGVLIFSLTDDCVEAVKETRVL